MWGEYVRAIGYGHSLGFPLVTPHNVQNIAYNLDGDGHPTVVMYMGAFISGMSGGPVFDKVGRVVGMVQRSSSVIGVGVNADALRQFLEDNGDVQ